MSDLKKLLISCIFSAIVLGSGLVMAYLEG